MPPTDPPAALPLAETRPPRVFLTAEWRYLAMVNYEVDPAVLRPLTPSGTELDTFQGKTFVSLVGFLFLNTRILGAPIPFHRNFEEINLRFYVRRRAPEGSGGDWRRGTVFIREIVPRWAIAQVARVIYNENYIARPMAHRVEGMDSPKPSAEYRWKDQGRWNVLGVDAEGAPLDTAVGSEEEFITEHYWGYTRQRDGGTLEYQVEHPRWKVWRATASRFDCDIAATYGQAFQPYLSVPAASAFLTEGSAVLVRGGRRLDR
jgi:uncharacterized protein YqjF (DUF2071 family)